MPRKWKRDLHRNLCNLCSSVTYLHPWCKACAYRMGVQVKPTGALGLCLFSTRTLCEGFTLPYGGELLSGRAIDKRYGSFTGPYVAGRRDASSKRSWAAMAAHSSTPNAILVRSRNSEVCLCLTKSVPTRSCITVDYGRAFWGSHPVHTTVGLWEILESEAFPGIAKREERERQIRHQRSQKRLVEPYFQVELKAHREENKEHMNRGDRDRLRNVTGSLRDIAYNSGQSTSNVCRWMNKQNI